MRISLLSLLSFFLFVPFAMQFILLICSFFWAFLWEAAGKQRGSICYLCAVQVLSTFDDALQQEALVVAEKLP